MKKNKGFTEEEEKRIQDEVDNHFKKVREAEVQAEINNRILEEQRKRPGYQFY